MGKWVLFIALFLILVSSWLVTPVSPLPVSIYNRSGVLFFKGSLKVLFGDGQSIDIFLNEESLPIVLSYTPIPWPVR